MATPSPAAKSTAAQIANTPKGAGKVTAAAKAKSLQATRAAAAAVPTPVASGTPTTINADGVTTSTKPQSKVNATTTTTPPGPPKAKPLAQAKGAVTTTKGVAKKPATKYNKPTNTGSTFAAPAAMCHYPYTPLTIGTVTVVCTSKTTDRWPRLREQGPTPHFQLYADFSRNIITRNEFLDWPDFGLPTNYALALEQIQDAYNFCENGVLEIGCIGGHGRTGTILAILYVLAGVDPLEAVDHARKIYCHDAVETQAQEWYVEWCAHHLDFLEEDPGPMPATLYGHGAWFDDYDQGARAAAAPQASLPYVSKAASKDVAEQVLDDSNMDWDPDAPFLSPEDEYALAAQAQAVAAQRSDVLEAQDVQDAIDEGATV